MVQNPEFPQPGLYSVHAKVAAVLDTGTVLLRSNEALVSVDKSEALPKRAHSRSKSRRIIGGERLSDQLGEVDSTMGDLTDLLRQAQQIASANVGSDVTADQRASASAVIQALYNQMLDLGNKQFEGVYLFGGDRSTTPPFVEEGGGVKFVGSADVLANRYDENSTLSFMVDGDAIFGALSTRVQGSVDLSPALSATTRLADVKGAVVEVVLPPSRHRPTDWRDPAAMIAAFARIEREFGETVGRCKRHQGRGQPLAHGAHLLGTAGEHEQHVGAGFLEGFAAAQGFVEAVKAPRIGAGDDDEIGVRPLDIFDGFPDF